MKTKTADDDAAGLANEVTADHPGLVVIHAGEQPQSRVLPLVRGVIEIGRDELAAIGIPDSRASRHHARIERDDDGWTVRDRGSRNGTFADGVRVKIAQRLSAPVVRVGQTLLLAVDDRRPFEDPGIVVTSSVVVGPALHAVHERIRLIARGGTTLLLHGESGTGKELAAAAFHAASGAVERPFVAVNCAAIQRDLAERVLFGARRGAYTGAVADAVGLVQAADGGTLFLDEIAELDPTVQAKLLRVLETKTVTPIGAVTPIPISLRLCAATNKHLRAEVRAGRFREDLFFRIGRPAVQLPALRDRREEIPRLVERALAALALDDARVTASTAFIEECLLRAWPGNVRELFAEVKTAAFAAVAAGRTSLAATDLDEEAGRAHEEPAVGEAESDARVDEPAPDRAAIEEALRSEQGNIARAAGRVGVTRSRMRRLIKREGIDVGALRST